MKHAVRHIHFVGIGLAGGGAPAFLSTDMPRPRGTPESKP
jgi:hypothetical protein